MFGHQFYNQSIRRYVIMFGNMFNDLIVQRLNTAGTVVQTIAVPITYAPKEAYIARLATDPNLTRSIAISLPAISFEMTDLYYDGTRRLSSTTKNSALLASDVNRLKTQFVPVPYNMNFSLNIYTRNADDAAQLLEQIIPYFGPEHTNSVNLIPSMGIVMDIPTILNSITTDDSYEGDFLTRRALINTLNFIVKGYFFGPISNTGVIKRAQTDLGVVRTGNTANPINAEDISRTGRSSRIVITPGLYANGSPSTNSATSIAYTLISANSNFGFASNTFFYSDGRKYNPRTGQDS